MSAITDTFRETLDATGLDPRFVEDFVAYTASHTCAIDISEVDALDASKPADGWHMFRCAYYFRNGACMMMAKRSQVEEILRANPDWSPDALVRSYAESGGYVR